MAHRSDSDTRNKDRASLLEALLAYALFTVVTYASRYTPAAMTLMALSGIGLPLAWGLWKKDWAEMGFTRRNLGPAIGWGIGIGLATCAIGLLMVKERSLAPDLWVELAVAVPMWLLLASPFQEFFFRGWLQPRFERGLGRWWGLLVSTLAFTAWHYALPIFGAASQSTFPINTLPGFLATFAAGLLYGIGFQRTRSIVTPWLAHALNGIMFVAIGSASFLQALP